MKGLSADNDAMEKGTTDIDLAAETTTTLIFIHFKSSGNLLDRGNDRILAIFMPVMTV